MKSPKVRGGFFVALLVNLVFNLEWTVPAWILLGIHFWLGISIKWFIGAIVLWVSAVAVKTIVLSWLIREGNKPDLPKENKNPYSSGKYKANK